MNSPMEAWPRKHRITVDEYYRMAEVGLLAPDARVELIEGEIIEMAPVGLGHSYFVDEIMRLLTKEVGDRALLRVQGAVQLDQRSQPQPDLALLSPTADRYRLAQPAPGDVLLLVEVSDSTLRYDREVKMPLYARHGIPEVWIVDLQNRELRWYRSPQDGRYLDQGTTNDPRAVPITLLPGTSVDLTALFAS